MEMQPVENGTNRTTLSNEIWGFGGLSQAGVFAKFNHQSSCGWHVIAGMHISQLMTLLSTV
eukprot:2671682-Amphidinium_carterae.1